ncbi:hypothetical protein GF324_01455 [bacterium]|nr:hypothetical protein [bacterium]
MDTDNVLWLPGLEPSSNGKKNGRNGKVPHSAELKVPEELEAELNLRKWHESTFYTGPWHNTVHHGDNMLTLTQMPAETVDLILTDPPYAINYASNRRVKNPKFQHLQNDNSTDWIPRFAEHAFRVLKNNRHMYCFCRHDTYPDFVAALQAVGFTLKRTLIWVKNNHGSGDLKGDYAPQDEWIIYCQKGRRQLAGKRHSNILYYNKVASKHLTHSTEKPIDLLKFLIGKSTHTKGELVLDPFAGSGSTMLAAIEMERAYCVIELAEYYYLTTAKRQSESNQFSLQDALYKIQA